MTDVDLMLRFLLQILVVLATCRVVGWIGKRFLGQTQVVMEMIAGVILGPSVLGAISPAAQNWLFPSQVIAKIDGVNVKHPSMSVLYVVAQIGLVIYMFLVGMEFDVSLVTKKMKGAAAVSLAGIAAPFLLGGALAYALAGRTDLFAAGVRGGEAALYMGAAMCITAFPMLARIIYERGISSTTMGTLALGAGAVDDLTAWSLLAVVLASFKHDAKYVFFALGGGVLFALIVFFVAKPLIARMKLLDDKGKLSQSAMLTTMLLLFGGAYATDAIGIYAVFGAFLIGAAMPRGQFVELMKDRLESLTVTAFLPFFFVYSGLNTKLGLLNTAELWLICGLACAAAILGKFGGCALAAKASGEDWRSSCAIGVLMNARGLMELIILNIGLQQKLITPTLFTMLVVMAILTTVMASPIFQWIYKEKPVPSMPNGTALG